MNALFMGLIIGVGVGLIFLTDFDTLRGNLLKGTGCVLLATGSYLVTQHFV